MKNIKSLMICITMMMLVGISTLTPLANAAGWGERTLAIGAVGQDVKLLQTKLSELGLYDKSADGVFGKQTRKAVMDFEQAQQIKIDGIADKQVFELLATYEPKIMPASEKSDKVLDIVATAYAPGPHDNGKWGNKTHLGTQIRPGVIAVDPRVIPLGTRVYIEFPDGHGMNAVAEDTGGAIKGNRIDIAMWTVAEAYDFGIQKVKVHILE